MTEVAKVLIHDDQMPNDGKPTGFGALVVRSDQADVASRLPVRGLDVEATIEGLLSRVTVRTTFRNTFDEALRAVYIFPLPAAGAVTSFFLRHDGRTIAGKVMERAEAIHAHEDAIRRGKTSALFEEDASETFTLEVGNIPPHAEVETELTFVAPVVIDHGRAWWRLPLVVGEKYIPGIPLPGDPVGDGTWPDTGTVPEGSRLNPPRLLPGMPNPIALGVRIDVDAGPLASIGTMSSTVPLQAQATGEGAIRLELPEGGADPDRDLILRWDLGARESLGGEFRVEPGDEERRAFVATLLAPTTEAEPPPRDVVILLDRSGSMGGWHMGTARKVADHLVERLRPVDRFLVVGFDHGVEMPRSLADECRLVEASDRAKNEARSFVGSLEARGGTELGAVLQRSLSLLDVQKDAEGREAAILLVTDAQVGDERRILAMQSLPKRPIPVYSVGVDQSLNAGLLSRLASKTGGYTTQVAAPNDSDEALRTVDRLLGRPRATDIEIETVGDGTLDAETLAPSTIAAMHGEVPTTVAGFLDRGVTRLRVRGRYVNGEEFAVDLQPQDGDAALLKATWAKHRIRDLEQLFDEAGRDVPEIRERIVATSVEQQVLSRFTAFLAIDEESEVAIGEQRSLVQPVAGDMDNLMDAIAGAGAVMEGDTMAMRSSRRLIRDVADDDDLVHEFEEMLRSAAAAGKAIDRGPKALELIDRILADLARLRDRLRDAIEILERLILSLNEVGIVLPGGDQDDLNRFGRRVISLRDEMKESLAEVERTLETLTEGKEEAEAEFRRSKRKRGRRWLGRKTTT